MHISEQVEEELLAMGWIGAEVHGRERVFQKRMKIAGLAGTISDGTRIVTLEISDTGRWLARVDGWGTPEVEVDLRDYQNRAKAAIKKVLTW